MRMLPFLASFLLSCHVRAEDFLMKGGRSPDGQYEVRIAREERPDPSVSNYSIRLYHVGTAPPIFILGESGGFMDYSGATESCRSLWHGTAPFITFTDRGFRHTQELYILAVGVQGAKRLALPDYVQNALGRVNATAVDFICVSTPRRWEGDDLVVSLVFTANGRQAYICEVVLHVSHTESSDPSVAIKSVSKPNGQTK